MIERAGRQAASTVMRIPITELDPFDGENAKNAPGKWAKLPAARMHLHDMTQKRPTGLCQTRLDGIPTIGIQKRARPCQPERNCHRCCATPTSRAAVIDHGISRFMTIGYSSACWPTARLAPARPIWTGGGT